MTERNISLRAEIVERLEILAERQQRSVDDFLIDLLNTYSPQSTGNWATTVAEGMEAAEISWLDDPDASINSRQHFQNYLHQKWEQTQNSGHEGD
jgi:predicted transcriptional regulator